MSAEYNVVPELSPGTGAADLTLVGEPTMQDMADTAVLEAELLSDRSTEVGLHTVTDETIVKGVGEVIVVSIFQDEATEDDGPQPILRGGVSNDPTKDYLKQVGKVPLLNAEMEVELSIRIETGLVAQRIRGQAQVTAPIGEKTKEKVEATDKQFAETVLKQFELPDREPSSDELAEFEWKMDALDWLIEDGKRAKDHLLSANLRLVVSLAKKYTGRGMDFLDLIQEGNLGLIRAVEKFDYTKGYKFSTYATWWIRQAITRGLADQSRTIRIPVHMHEVINKMNRTKRQMMQDLGREPTPEEVAEELEITAEKVIQLQKYARDPVSIHQPLGHDVDGEFGDLIEDTEDVPAFDTVQHGLLREQLSAVLDTLTEREAGVIRMRFGLDDGRPKTLDEIGKVYGVTRERIRQVESKTMSKLRNPSRSQVLEDFLD